MTTLPHSKRLALAGRAEAQKLTHYLFRYPAKFHPPVVRALLEDYTQPGDMVLDPFVGSGTLMVEAAVAGRSSLGLDTDPVAVAVAEVKVHRYQVKRLQDSVDALVSSLARHRRSDDDYWALRFKDISMKAYQKSVPRLQKWIPPIPNLFHWFRKYVILDLARIRRAIETAAIPESHRTFLRVVFASIIRNSSNADPVPVSGLEVTSHMKQRDAEGRLVDPFTLFERASDRAVQACAKFATERKPGVTAQALQADATRLEDHLEGYADAVITSPPYHGAVDYYRRHQLEMFWLGHTASHEERLDLLRTYIGRPHVPQTHPFVENGDLTSALAATWEARMRRVSERRADAFRHYLVAMSQVFAGVAGVLRRDSLAVFVVGHSSWNGTSIPTTRLFAELAGPAFNLEEVLWYPVKNRYMSYKRRNGVGITKEYVLVFRRTAKRSLR